MLIKFFGGLSYLKKNYHYNLIKLGHRIAGFGEGMGSYSGEGTYIGSYFRVYSTSNINQSDVFWFMARDDHLHAWLYVNRKLQTVTSKTRSKG